jgi:hypothetical protein
MATLENGVHVVLKLCPMVCPGMLLSIQDCIRMTATKILIELNQYLDGSTHLCGLHLSISA